MSPLPQQTADHWRRTPTLPPGEGQLYWHVLLGRHPEVVALVCTVQRRLAGFPGFDPTPHRWLHMTTLIAGRTRDIGPAQRDTMVAEATRLLAHIRPISVTLAHLLYHPEAIAVAARPVEVLNPVLDAAQAATHAATGHHGALAHQPWTPHVTVAYSSAVQPAAPIIAALGREVPPCEVTVRAISLVQQDGPESRWIWKVIADVPLGTAVAPARPDGQPCGHGGGPPDPAEHRT